MLEESLKESTSQTRSNKQKQKKSSDQMPPTSHTLIDLLITMSVHLPRSTYPKLFSIAALLLSQASDPQLQKKAYKLLPRLASSTVGTQALKERNAELQHLLLSTAESSSPPARRDRLNAIAVVVKHLPPSSLHFIASILSEIVLSVKEPNEKARNIAFDLLVQMGRRMAEGGSIAKSKIPHMPNDAPTIKASLEEYFTMVSAGLAGTTPHMVSASITAITNIVYEFRSDLPNRVIEDIVSTMDVFLTSKTREIVRSVLSFCKVAITSLPDNIINPRLATLIPSVLSWGHEHANKLRAKVKNIIERAIRRFGYEIIVRYCPEEDKKLIQNVKKTKERKKRKKAAATTAEDEADEPGGAPAKTGRDKAQQRHSKFESEFDAAVYSSAESSDTDADLSRGSSSDNEISSKQGRKGRSQKHEQAQNKSYIIEPASPTDDPLDLLDSKAYANVSTTKPMRLKENLSARHRNKAKTDLDGKLIFNEDEDENMLDAGNGKEPGDGTLKGGINAYVAAIRGQDVARRGRGGKLKFSNRWSKANEDDEMDVDDEDDDDNGGGGKARAKGKEKAREKGRERNADNRGARSGKGMPPRKGLDGEKKKKEKDGGRGVKGGRFRVAKQRARAGGRSGKGGSVAGR